MAFLIGLAITGMAFIVFFAFPTRNSYLATPGVMLAFMTNGGVHGGGLGKLFGVWFWVIAAGTDFLLYSLIAWIAIKSYIRTRPAARS